LSKLTTLLTPRNRQPSARIRTRRGAEDCNSTVGHTSATSSGGAPQLAGQRTSTRSAVAAAPSRRMRRRQRADVKASAAQWRIHRPQRDIHRSHHEGVDCACLPACHNASSSLAGCCPIRPRYQSSPYYVMQKSPGWVREKKHPWMRLFLDSFDNTHPGAAQKDHKFWFINKSSQLLFEQLVRSTTNHQTARSLRKTTKELTHGSKATVSRKRPPRSMWFTITPQTVQFEQYYLELCLASGRRHDGQCLRHRRHGSQRRFKDVLRASRLHNGFHLHKHCKRGQKTRPYQNYLSAWFD
jgi:hypothetical protein